MSLTSTASHAYNRLAEELSLGVHPSGERLPGERQLAARLGVSRVTLRTALAALEGEGKLTREAHRGWFVPSNIVGEPPSTLQSFTEMATARGLNATARVLRQDYRPATIEEAEKLRIAPSSTVIQIDRVRGMDGTPVGFDVVVIPHQDAARLLSVNLTDVSLYNTLREECDISVYRSAYTVMASTADTTLARLLNTSVGSAILVGDEIAYTAEGTPILLGTTRYRGDAYRFHADLYRRS